MNVSMAYRPSLSGTADEAIRVLAGLRERELRFGTSLAGPHRDAVEVLRDGQTCRNTVSLGQARLIAVCVRLAQASWLADGLDEEPVILLDDATAELDGRNRGRFRSFYAERYGLYQTLEALPSGNGDPAEQKADNVVVLDDAGACP